MNITRAVLICSMLWLQTSAIYAAGTPATPSGFQPAEHYPDHFVASGRDFDVRLGANAAVIDINNDSPVPVRLRMSIEGADPQAAALALEPLQIKQQPAGARTYARVAYHDIYPGIDLSYYGHHGQLEYDFAVAPRADPARIRLSFPGNTGLDIEPASGDLVIHLAGTDVHHARPVIYQLTEVGRVQVEGHYRLLDSHTVAFTVGAYDQDRALIIDPTMTFRRDVDAARKRARPRFSW
jgi:hypothetical protein